MANLNHHASNLYDHRVTTGYVEIIIIIIITGGSKEVPGRNACDRRHTYRIIIIIIDVAISGHRNAIKKEAEKILKYKDIKIDNTAHVECENKGDTNNNRGDWDYFKVISKIREQHTRKT